LRVCPNCGYENEETATICDQCSRALPPPAAPTQPPATAPQPAPQAPIPLPAAQPQDRRRKLRQYFLGLGLGLIPLLIFLPGLGLSVNTPSSPVSSALLIASLVLYLASIIAMIVCLSIRKVRFVGYGFLTTVSASPIIAFISCTVIVLTSLRVEERISIYA